MSAHNPRFIATEALDAIGPCDSAEDVVVILIGLLRAIGEPGVANAAGEALDAIHDTNYSE